MKKVLIFCAVSSLFVGDAGAMQGFNQNFNQMPESMQNDMKDFFAFKAKKEKAEFEKAQAEADRQRGYYDDEQKMRKERDKKDKVSPFRKKIKKIGDVFSGVTNLIDGAIKVSSTTVRGAMYSVAMLPTAWSIGGRACAWMLGWSPAVSFWSAGGLVSALNLSINGYKNFLEKGKELRSLTNDSFVYGQGYFERAGQNFDGLIDAYKKRLFGFASGKESANAKKIRTLKGDKIQLYNQRSGYLKKMRELYEAEISLIDIEGGLDEGGFLDGESGKKLGEIKRKYLGYGESNSEDSGFEMTDKEDLESVRSKLRTETDRLNGKVKELSKEISRTNRKLGFYKVEGLFSKVGSFAKGGLEDGIKVASMAWNTSAGAFSWGMAVLGGCVGFPLLLASCSPGIVGLLAYDGLRSLGFWRLKSWMIAEGLVFLSDSLVNGASVWKKFGKEVSDGIEEGFKSIDTGLYLLFPSSETDDTH